MQLSLQNICKRFGAKQVLDEVSLTATSGRACGLLGRNGAGKTTAIRILLNVFPSDSGQVLLDGAPIDYAKVKFGYLPEERGLYPKKQIFDQLVYFARLKGMSKREAAVAVDKWLDRLGMSDYRDKRLETLSKGNQQKIQLITALCHDPDIVVLDEPFSGLDPVNALLLKDVVSEVISDGKIVLFSSHQMNYIEEFCDDIAVLNNGKIVLSGDLRDIKRSYPRNKLVVRSGESQKIIAELNRGERITDDEIMLTFPEGTNISLAMRLVTERYAVDELRIYEPSLNDIFVSYAGDDHQKADKEGQQ